MKIVRLKIKRNPYDIVIGSNILSRLGSYLSGLRIGNAAYVISNQRIKARHGASLRKALINSCFTVRFKIVPDSEKAKSLEMASSIINDIVYYEKGKRVFVLAFGGGVIGDLSGFTASIYKRGIPYIQVPTTLLAQVDSSIGGKTAVDLKEGKNLLGAFYQPRLVFSDTKFLKTLPVRQIRSGLAEVIKYAAIKDPELFSYLAVKFPDILEYNITALNYIVERCSKIKAAIVQQDEREEKGIRTVLNFGHTIGHAIEAAGDYKGYNHGEAVALGMLVACGIGERLKISGPNTKVRLERLIEQAGLPTKIKALSIEKIIKAHYRDKKFIGTKNKFVLLENIGKAKIIQNVPFAVIREAILERFR